MMTIAHAKFLALVPLALLLAACPGGGNDSDSTTGDTTTTNPDSDSTTGTETPTTSGPTSSTITDGSTGTDTDDTTDTTDPTGVDEATKAECLAVFAAQDALTVKDCECATEGEGPGSLEECLEENAQQLLLDCACDLVASDPSNATPTMCQRAAWEELAACLADRPCDDVEECYELFPKISDCGIWSEATFDGFDECIDPSTQFMCTSGESVPKSYVCDFEADCRDGSDEVDCEGGFDCGDGQKVPERSVCDLFPNCRNGADEQDCEYFECGDGESIPKDWVCDGDEDCEDASDEQDC